MTGIIVAVSLCGNTMAALPLERQASLGTGEVDVSSKCFAVAERPEKAEVSFSSLKEAQPGKEEIAK